VTLNQRICIVIAGKALILPFCWVSIFEISHLSEGISSVISCLHPICNVAIMQYEVWGLDYKIESKASRNKVFGGVEILCTEEKCCRTVKLIVLRM
jgi:hypothetical protein